MKAYLGDSVYVERDAGGGFVLTTENGMGPSNTIYLEPEVYRALFAYVVASLMPTGTDTPAPGCTSEPTDTKSPPE